MERVLIIDPDQWSRATLSRALSSDYQLVFGSIGGQFFERLRKEAFNAIILDLGPKPANGLQDLERIKKEAPYTPVVVTSATEKAELVVQAIKRGGYDYVAKPFSPEKIRVVLQHASESSSMRNEIDYLRREQDVVYSCEEIIAESPAMQQVLTSLKKLSKTDSTVLMTGETGTGKSFLSGNVHFNSARKSKPFVKVNCANIPETLLESELFGHEKGAFTDAGKIRIGRFEQANGGTVFLDEIGELSPALQAKLLRVLEDKAFERLGGNQTIRSDIRIIAATNRNVEDMVAKGVLRADLYFRINVLRIHLPPLRERRECIERLAHYLLMKTCRAVKKRIERFSKEALDILTHYHFPGNIRELSNMIERAVLWEDSHIIQKESLTLPTALASPPATAAEPMDVHADYLPYLIDQERELILDALEKSLWIQKDAAERLGISPRVLNYKVKKFGITHKRWRKNRSSSNGQSAMVQGEGL
ncbi:MAG: sigma-54-dependent transcriptional regulator [Syntrophobacteraceae bacterium]